MGLVNKVNATITAMGFYVPDKVLDNKYFEGIVDTSDEWIVSRSGIKERRILEQGPASDLGARAVLDLFEKHNVNPDDIDVVICTTVTPDMFFPNTACMITGKAGIKNAWAFDLNGACSGFLYGLQTGAAFIESGRYKKVLVVGAEKMTSITDYTDRNTCILFGDAGSAILLEPTEDLEYGLVDSILHSNDKSKDVLYMLGGGSLHPSSHETVDKKMHYVYQEGKSVFKEAVTCMADVSAEIMEKNKLTADDVAYLVPHQANLRIISATAKRMGVSDEKVMLTIHKYGNTTSVTIPSCLYEYYHNKKLKKGDKLVFAAFGGGYTWGSVYFRWSMD